jgi:hypothetical protein
MNFTAAIINLIDHLPDGVKEEPREDHLGTTFFDGPRRGPAAKSQQFCTKDLRRASENPILRSKRTGKPVLLLLIAQ